MVEQLIQNNNGRNNTIALDLDAIDNDGGLNQTIGGGEKQEKVILEQPTEATISNCDLTKAYAKIVIISSTPALFPSPPLKS